MQPTGILGVDPGSRCTGWAVIHQRGRELAVADSGIIRLREEQPLCQRLGQLQEQLEELIARFVPETVAVEDIFAAKNVRSALALGHARGVILAAAGRSGLAVHAYPPATVKRAVCGHGRADKKQIQRMVQVLLSLPALVPEDEADAMAIAVCHALSHRAGSPLAAAAATRRS